MLETSNLALCYIGSASGTTTCEWSELKWLEAVARQQATDTEVTLESLAQHGQALVDRQKLPIGFTKWGDNRYNLQPEAIESVFVMYCLAGDESYMDIAWTMWSSISKACKAPLAYAGVLDVRPGPPAQSD